MSNVDTLTQGRLKELLDYFPDTGLFKWKVFRGNTAKPKTIAGSIDSNGHGQIKVDGITYQAHRLAWLYVNGVWPSKEIDHRNGIRNDNHIANLREANHSENGQNQRKARTDNKSSGILGVTWHKRDKKWRAQIGIAGKKKWLGAFDTPEAAHSAYITAKRELHQFGTL